MNRTGLLAVVAAVLLVAPMVVAGSGPASRSGVASVGIDAGSSSATQANPCVGTVREEPERTTLVAIQGARGGDKTAGMVVSVRPDGQVRGVHNGSANNRWWIYDVDRLDSGNLLLSTTGSRHSIVEEIDPETGEHVETKHFQDVLDSHDADLINGDELLLNDMSKEGEDRVIVYNLTREEIVWEYRFAEHTDEFPKAGGGNFSEDWTHNNDVEKVEDGVYMVSVRNFDQVVAINRSTKKLEWTLGEDGDHDVLFEQHNPDYIESEDGTPTVLVADSLNDRVVEYERAGDDWEQTWVARGGELDEPRDADRLPNGNTLIADRRGHRIVEVTPGGEVVWEFYTPWQPYDVERLGTGDESSNPTMRDHRTTGVAELSGGAEFETEDIESCYNYLTGVESQRLVPETANTTTQTNATPTVATPVATTSVLDRSDDGVPVRVLGIVALVVGAGLVAGLVRRLR